VAGVLQVEGLRKSFARRGAAPVWAVDGVSLHVAAGEVVGLLGANGAGKTTTIKAICGLVTPTAGTINVGGHDVARDRRGAARCRAAVLEGNRTIYWRLNMRENLEFAAALRGLPAKAVRPTIDDLVVRFGLEDRADLPAMKLSRGMQQKLSLACAVVTGAPLLLLDEPTLGLDVQTSRELRTFLTQLAHDDGAGILLSSHDMKVVRDVADRVVIIKAGRVVVDDRVENLLTLFGAQRLLVSLAAPLAVNDLALLRDRFDVTCTELAAGVALSVLLSGSDDVYELIDRLRAAGAVIEGIDRDEPDLEDVFLRVIADGGPV
jgi:ABC-2 type transport system ATP-binding protein